MTSRIAAPFTALMATLMLMGSGAPTRATEVVHFESAVLPPSPFKQRLAKTQGKELKPRPGFPIWGHLSVPEGKGPFPALVLMHGCAGLFPTHARWSSQFVEWGYVTLILDSFGPRSTFNVCKDPMGVVSPDLRGLDAHGALAHLQGRALVDPNRIAVVGWSHGGNAALSAVDDTSLSGPLPTKFTAAVAFYPYCFTDETINRPSLILAGEADEWGPVIRCRDMKAQDQNAGADIEVIAFPGVFHGFDVLELQEGSSAEGMNGRTFRLQYDKEAHEDAVERVRAFLAEHMSQR